MIQRAPFAELACCFGAAGFAAAVGPLGLIVLTAPFGIMIARAKTMPDRRELGAFFAGVGLAWVSVFFGANWGLPILFLACLALAVRPWHSRPQAASLAGLGLYMGISGGAMLSSAAVSLSIALGAAALVFRAFEYAQNQDRLMDLSDKVERRAARVRYLLQERDEVTALAVHDLQSPIQAIAGMQKTMLVMLDQNTMDRPAMKAALHTAIETNDDLSNRIGSLLSSNRDHLGGNAVKTRLEDIVQATIAAHKLDVRARRMRITRDLEPGLFLHNQEDIKDVLDVLFDNAIQHTPNGGRIEFRAKIDGKKIDISVHDSGPGVSPDRLANLFLPPNDQSSGVGRRNMGLYLAKRRAIRLGGGLYYKPSPLGGAAFHVFFART